MGLNLAIFVSVSELLAARPALDRPFKDYYTPGGIFILFESQKASITKGDDDASLQLNCDEIQ